MRFWRSERVVGGEKGDKGEAMDEVDLVNRNSD